MDAPALPTDLATCRTMIREQAETIARQQRELDQVRHRLDLILRRLYGPRSEKLNPDQLLLFDEPAVGDGPAAAPAPDRAAANGGAATGGHGRRPLPATLPRVRVVEDLPEAERVCPSCQGRRVCIGEDVSEQLDYRPASLFVVQRVRPKYACPKCRCGVIAAEPPVQPIAKGLPGPGLLAHVIVSKFADHLPLYRQEAMLARHGVDLTRSTMCGWLAACADLLRPLYDRMVAAVIGSKVIHADDTPVRLRDESPAAARQGHVWAYVGDAGHPYTVYDFRVNHARDGPVTFLTDFHGYLQADAYAGYHDLYARGVTEVACWAHARRNFFDARTTDAAAAHPALAYVRRLYDVEDRAKEMSAADRRRVRQAEAAPVLAEFRGWLDRQRPAVLPKSPIGRAITYALGNWAALERYTTDGDLAIDNNPAERALRGVALGRKNWLFFGSEAGGHTAAVLLSLIATCKRHAAEPFAYLRDVLTRLPVHPAGRLDELLPAPYTTPRATLTD